MEKTNNHAQSSSILFECLVNHVALPPRLPGKQEENLIQIEQELLRRLQDAARVLQNDGLSDLWDCVRHILEICKNLNARRKLDKARLLAEFHTLQRDVPLILHVTEQNTGLLIWRQHRGQDDLVVFECFEASAVSEKVLASENALLWDFPGEAVAIPYATFANAQFQDSLAGILEQASTESIKRFTARAAKAGSSPIESRDTVNPALITQMLMTIFEANGSRIFPTLLRKRIRDDVCWAVGAEKPWRRSAFWLVIRVGIERYLCSVCEGDGGRVHYKFLLCALLSRLIDDSLSHITPESLVLLKKKLARRLAKLQMDQAKASPNIQAVYEQLFTAVSSRFQKSIRASVNHIESIWSDMKIRTRRPIPKIPPRADKKATTLSLPNSATYLEQAMSHHQSVKEYLEYNQRKKPGARFDIPGENHFATFARSYYKLSDLEESNGKTCFAMLDGRDSQDSRCMKLAAEIEKYLDAVSDSYENNTEQKSVMILNVMRLWVALDQCANALFSLLKDFHPGISPETLDILQLPLVSDMVYLQNIQGYLRERCNKACRKTIFDEPVKGCFAERYYDESADSKTLEALHMEIEASAQLALNEKEREWRRLSAKFEELERDIANSNCLFVTNDFGTILHDDKRCRKCYLQRCSRRMRIEIHEYPLPSSASEAKAVIFELACPNTFKAYRNATWRLLCTLALPNQTQSHEPRLLLEEYSELQKYVGQMRNGVCLASATKSFLSTHYSGMRFPIPLDAVCLPNGLKLAYFDNVSKLWVSKQFRTPNFAHHFRMNLPLTSPFSSIMLSVGSSSPSSYEVIASQTQCPSRLNLHEFMAYKALFSGNSRRWPSILVELGSANLNLSTEATTSLISQLTVQAGPADERDHLRIAHKIFRDLSFCHKLLEQVSHRLNNIFSNWRETNCMDMLLTLILRLCSIAPSTVRKEAITILEKARAILFKWISQLRNEIHQCRDAAAAERFAEYGFWAALLCRRTFSVYVDNVGAEALGDDEITCFIEASVTLQDNAPSDLTQLPSLLKNALVRDVKMVYRMRFILRESLIKTPSSLCSAVDALWPQAEGASSRSYSEPEFVDSSPDWVRLTVNPTVDTRQQIIYYHLLEGHLIVDGHALGKLPPTHRKSLVLEQLFGKQRLLIYPSSLFGMTYRLAFPINGHEIHFGFRDGNMVVQARVRNTILEHIPPEIFGDPKNFDLPGSLVMNCVHWLDLNTGIMEIRRRPDIWISKRSHWRLNLTTRQARRNQKLWKGVWKWGSLLVDPHSRLFKLIARVFDHFEYRNGLTVFQPRFQPLSVELRRLELSFEVNSRGLLQCQQLRAEIDPDQDAGTWYGLDSKLVFRDVSNISQRTILVPMGQIQAVRNGFHVAIRVSNEGVYGRFGINNVLGRLDCPAEPWLLYQKAQFHAYTSFVVPDPLTGRTGTEEAIHCLRTAHCQPWTTLNIGPIRTLEAIANLAPKRTYYPSGIKAMQHVTWDPNLTSFIQHEGFWPVINNILRKARILSSFSLKGEIEVPDIASQNDSFLLKRAYWRRSLYQRLDAGLVHLVPPSDLRYEARDQFICSQARLNVFESSTLIKHWSPEMCASIDLATTLQKWPNIGGFSSTFDKFLLSDLLDIELDMFWGSLVNFCRTIDSQEKYRLMFIFGIMSFRADVDMAMIRTLLAFAVIESLKELDPPKWPSYINFRFRQLPTLPYLKELMKPCCVQYVGDERGLLHLSYKTRQRFEATQHAHELQVDKDCTILAELLWSQWPCAEPKIEDVPSPLLVDTSCALNNILPEWLRLFQNMELSNYLAEVQSILDSHRSSQSLRPLSDCSNDRPVIEPKARGQAIPSLSKDLLSKNCQNASEPSFLIPYSRCGIDTIDASHSIQPARETYMASSLSRKAESMQSLRREMVELTDIVRRFETSESMVQKQYCHDLLQSIQALGSIHIAQDAQKEVLAETETLQLDMAREDVRERFNKLNRIFEKLDSRFRWLKDGDLWPCITPVTLLEQLRSSSKTSFGKHMKEILTAYAVSIVSLQRTLRMEDARLRKSHQRLTDELKNVPHINWNPVDHPDWVLLEIEADITIRQDQVDVARATISPSSGANSVLQMNMGQGKTSCIMPMVAAELADTTRLVRLVVPKALLAQTAQLLQTRLGGLIGREVRHVPFSRKTPTNLEMIKAYFDIFEEMRTSSGVIITLPEHILSFKLSGLQRLSESRITEAKTMVKIHSWMQKMCRDILDECDFTLAIRTQLIYPSGSQSAVHGHPHRWETAQELLRLVGGHLWNLQRDFPQSIEVISRANGGFPFVFFLRKDAEDELLVRITRDIIRGQTSLLPIRDCSLSDRLAIKSFICNATVQPEITEIVGRMFPDNLAARQNAYLLRGLLVHRILILTLKKRWNVQYGLHPDRDPIAVPFTAKGVPSEQAEWGHPDVAILFTCLAFYFGGLTEAQLRQSIDHLVKSDDPSSEYDRWTQASDALPGVLREWSVIEADDEAQLAELWQHLRYQVVVIDYFLNHFVFPKHAKQFQFKLQASGWDIPLFSPRSQGMALTTGFSGTNDNRTLLPLNINQRDLPALSHTNAEVLTYLLQPRNREYVVAADDTGRRLSEIGLLELLVCREINMLIDSGAQILEMGNQCLATEWLKVSKQAPAVMYFDCDNKPYILYRNGARMPLLASPYADNLGDCLVYLDESHTRGTDLKMPRDTVGALTLGLGQTKDHTVQAAMRLRQLATTQSVIFVAPPEVHQSILDLQGKQNGDKVDSNDVVSWLLKQTCLGIEQVQPLYYSQGMDFCRRIQAALDNPQFLVDKEQQQSYCSVLRQDEKQTLEQLYKPGLKSKPTIPITSYAPEIAKFVKELKKRRKAFQDFGGAVQGSALQEVEQEREVAFEVEAVREVQKPVHYTPLSFPGLHPDISRFAITGQLSGFAGYQQAFVALKDTALGQKHGISSQAAMSKLFVSKEFMRTVKLPVGRRNDNFLRPVNWVIWSFESETAMIVIPEEAELLIPMFQQFMARRTHLLTYAAPVTRKMLHFNDLNFYAIPALPSEWKSPKWLTIQLGILSGRVYFGFDEYEALCEYLDVGTSKGSDDAIDCPLSPTSPSVPKIEDHGDCMMEKGTNSQKSRSFTAKPLAFLQDWLSLKRRGQEFTHTPMGYVCQGKPLTESHPFFSKIEPGNPSSAKAARAPKEGDTRKQEPVEVEDDFDSEMEYEGAEYYDGNDADGSDKEMSEGDAE
ncbi:hypothetical protein PRK78_005173 [Emydomyces testavorans]|uniref:ubiquitinyl hydrolase 1 n=1 Tax=Emydomyces testavorans TaxID=2070801 RepID=A0AAF0DK56_9EURO|nr:hypothetical protein PRK78_005173 [Emydomyces testavorans]